MADANEKPAAGAEKEDEELDDEELDDEPEDSDKTDWKAEAIKARRIASRYRNKVTKLTEAKKEEPKPDSKPKAAEPGSLDYAQKAYLAANGIKGAEEFAFVSAALKDTGKDLDTLLESKYFQSELQTLRDDKAAKDATPSSTKRGSAPARDSVDYWLPRIESGQAKLSDITDPALRGKVVNARIAGAHKGPFYNS